MFNISYFYEIYCNTYGISNKNVIFNNTNILIEFVMEY